MLRCVSGLDAVSWIKKHSDSEYEASDGPGKSSFIWQLVERGRANWFRFHSGGGVRGRQVELLLRKKGKVVEHSFCSILEASGHVWTK